MHVNSRIYIAGSDTLVGFAITRSLRAAGYRHVLTDTPGDRDSHEHDIAEHRPEYVFHAAGRSGGIRANQSFPADLCQDNLQVTSRLLAAAHRYNVRRLLYLASACCYPRNAPQPLAVESLWSGPLEPTNEAYAAAKLAGIALCRAYRHQHGCDFVVGIPTNAFGPGDDFDPDDGHVIASLIARMHEAKELDEPQVTIWGSGKPVREFLYVDDLADACLHVMRQPGIELINLAGGDSLSIAELAERIRNVVGYQGRLEFDRSRPDGMPLKSLDAVPLFATRWKARTSFDAALAATYQWYLTVAQELAHVG